MLKIRSRSLLLSMFALLALMFGLFGCSSSSTDSTPSDGQTGELAISLTDAAGDFASYTVDVVSLSLTRADGTTVEALPLTTQIDFAQYTEMTEFLTAATVPAGRYTAATLTLDYQNADIWVENEAGDTVQATTLLDEDGNPLTTLEVSVQLENTASVVIAPGIPVHLALDFDLAASNSVTFDAAGDPAVTVSPMLLAEVDIESDKIHRVRGPLDSVDVDNGTFDLIVRPFRHLLSNHHKNFGMLTVTTDDETVFDLDEQSYTGQDGISALNELPRLTGVIAVGAIKFKPFRFEADEVYAGSSVPGGIMDAVTGNVISRSGNTLVVKGATLTRYDSSVVFNDQVTVTVGENTVVRQQFATDTLTADAISVGQRVRIFGTLTETDDPAELTMDATQGYAQLLLTTLRGTVADVDPDNETAQLTLNLASIDCRDIGLFDFAGTGIDAEHDADPATYEINTGSLDLSTFETGAVVRVRGFVTPFGTAPADFNTQTLISAAHKKYFVKVKWHPPTGDAFESLTDESMVLDLTHASLFHHAGSGRVVVDLNTLPASPTIMPVADDSGLYVIVWRGTVDAYADFATFTADIAERLEEGRAVNKLDAYGEFDRENATVTANLITIKMQ